MENWWGNQWRRYAGHIGDTSTITNTYNHFIKNTFGTEDGSNIIGYGVNAKVDGAPVYIDTLCKTVQGSKYIRASKFINTVTYSDKTYNIANFLASNNDLPGEVGSSTYYCDYFYQTNTIHYAIRGNYSRNDVTCGIFCIALSIPASYSEWFRGASLSFKPIT